MSIGTVKWFNENKGYGFVSPEGGGEDLFIHHSNIATEGFRTLHEGQKVEFESAAGRKGPEAINLRPC
ncbi:MAG: cold shock domain-containing protein [Candidatus Sumerlaeota bacterium]|nr:cold shock domain-containing protein [Candidatus Sumerlaeota bacterium]